MTKNILVAFVLSLLCCARSNAIGANTNDPEQLRFNLRTTVDAYNNVGSRNPAWDSVARKCLDEFARNRALPRNDMALISALRKDLAQAEELGCEDPLVQYLIARYLYIDSHSHAENVEEMNRVATALETSKYPDIRKYYVVSWQYKMVDAAHGDSSVKSVLLTQAANFLGKALQDRSMGLREASQACDTLMTAPWWPEPMRWNLYCLLEPALTNQWAGTELLFLNKGRAYLTHGWEARGSGYADTVTAEGWQLLAERLDIAAQSLQSAWALDTNDVQICIEMMRVELGQGKGIQRLNTWFNRGMAIDHANHDLCDQKLEYLSPRWYGSEEQMINFGRQCTANTHWSGSVRLMLADAHYKASTEIQDDDARAAYWSRPEVWEDIHSTFEQFFKLYPKETGYRHNYAQYAYWCGQYTEFNRQISLFSSTNFTYFGGKAAFNKMVRIAAQHAKNP